MRFAVVGDCTLDIVVTPARRRRHGSDVPATIGLGPGGQAANVAVRLARLGQSVRLVAPLADDEVGRLLRAALAREDMAISPLPAVRTAAVALLIDPDGERTMLSDRQSLDVTAVGAALTGAGWIHCSAYALFDDGSGDALALLLGGRRPEVRLSVGGSAAHQRDGIARLRRRLRSAAPDLCLLSRDEAGALLGARPPAMSDLAVGLAGLAQIVVVTAGAEGSAATLQGDVLPVLPARSGEPIVDATGAGDAYAAAMIARLAAVQWPPRPAQLRRAMVSAGRLGARVARVAGAQGRVRGERVPAA
jgi:sugar/nucleoside kinase (ribokinase family)